MPDTAFGALQIVDNATVFTPLHTGSTLTAGWSAVSASTHGNNAIVASASAGSLTCVPGVYDVSFNASIQGAQVSGTSGPGIGVLTVQIMLDGVAQAKAKIDILADAEAQQLSIRVPVEVAATAAGVLTVQFLGGPSDDQDLVVSEASFMAVKLT